MGRRGLRTQSDRSLSSCEVATSAGFIWGTECERLASRICKADCARVESILRKRLDLASFPEWHLSAPCNIGESQEGTSTLEVIARLFRVDFNCFCIFSEKSLL